MRLRQNDVEANEARHDNPPDPLARASRRPVPTAAPPPAPPPAPGTVSIDALGSELLAKRSQITVPVERGAQRTLGAREAERTLGTNDLVGESYLELALLAAQPVCRVSVFDADRRFGGHATGFLIAPHVLLTNWHVFRDTSEATHSFVEFDYRVDLRGQKLDGKRFDLRPDELFFADPDLDYAVVAVAPVSADGAVPLSRYGYHRIGERPGSDRWMTIIQHPGGEPRQFAIRENERTTSPDGDEDPRFVWYQSDTAQGSSGAPVFNDGFRVVALHHFGRARKEDGKYVLRDGRRVDSLDHVDDSDVLWERNEGVCGDGLVADIRARIVADAVLAASERGRELLAALDGDGDIITRALAGAEIAHRTAPAATVPPAVSSGARLDGMQIHVGQITVAQMFVGGQHPPIVAPISARAPMPTPTLPPPAAPGAGAEITKPPVIDTHYSNRRGYRPAFLRGGLEVPLPTLRDMTVVSRLDDGEHEIPYQHFTIVQHRRRRLAVYTAANVDHRAATHPSGSDYTRKVLGGFAKNDREAWISDPRIPQQHQLPNRFYDYDRKAFDKGHLVRREDVCFGSTYAVIQRANGDTYHVTNCSPQVNTFNQSSKSGAWGLFENHVKSESERERYCVFAGPVFDDDDPWFEGRDDHGPVRIQIPQAYWKMIVARVEDALAAYAFVLEQDLRGVRFTEEEFAVTSEWVDSMIAIPDLMELVGLDFDPAIAEADRYGAIEESEMARSRVRKRARVDGPPVAARAPAPKAAKTRATRR